MAESYYHAAKSLGAQASKMQFSGERPSVLLYLGLASIALLKDLLDLAGIGSLPGIGTVVTFCFSLTIWLLMTTFDHSGGKSSKKEARGLVMVFLGLVEAIGFGLNFLPIETFTVILLYIMARIAWKKEQKRLQSEEKVQTNPERIRAYQRAQSVASEQAVDVNEQEPVAEDESRRGRPVRTIV